MKAKARPVSAVFHSTAVLSCAICLAVLVRYSHWSTSLVLFGSGLCATVAFAFMGHLKLRRTRQSHPIKLDNLAAQNGVQSRWPRHAYFVIVLGSGGHTKEMLAMMETNFPQMDSLHRRYIVSSGDTMSIKHLYAFEDKMKFTYGNDSIGTFDVHVVTRARKIHQPLWTTPISALRSIIEIFPLLLESPCDGFRRQRYPDIIVTNGPATGFMVALVAHVLKVFRVVPSDSMQVFFIESWARIKSLSLTGKLFYHTHIADMFLVQHSEVAQKYGVANAGWMVVRNAGR